MFSANVTAFLLNLVKKGEIVLNCDDEIIRETLVAHEGQVVHPRLRELLGLPTAGAARRWRREARMDRRVREEDRRTEEPETR